MVLYGKIWLQDKISSVQVDVQKQRPDLSDLTADEDRREKTRAPVTGERTQVSAEINYLFSLCSIVGY